MIPALSIWLLTLIIDLWTDYRLWLKRRPVNHVRGAMLRLIGLVPAGIFGGWWFIPVALLCYTILFDGLYNILTGQNWFRVGETAALDKLQRRYPWLVWVIYIAAAGNVVMYITKAG